MRDHNSAKKAGFTLIEILIVLAIAALILLIVFLVVPSARRIERDNSRKSFAQLIAAQMDQYYAENSSSYADDPTHMCTFITTALREQGMTSCSPSYNAPKDCVLVTGNRFSVCYHETDTSPHSYIGPQDEISIQLGHYCSPGTTGDPITDSGGTHLMKHYVVWTKMEGSARYCVDNYPG